MGEAQTRLCPFKPAALTMDAIRLKVRVLPRSLYSPVYDGAFSLNKCNQWPQFGCRFAPSSLCRHCYDLTYRSSQEGIEFKSMFEMLALQMQDEYPGLTRKDTRAMLEGGTTENLK